MLYEKLKKQLNNTSDLKHKTVNNVHVVFLESLCSSDKIDDYILKNLTLGNGAYYLNNIISGSNIVNITKESDILDYLFNGFALAYDDKDMIVCECKAELFRSIDTPSVEPSINGPKDAFIESIQANLGLIRRRVRTDKLVNEDFTIGKKTKTQVSLLYLNGVVKHKHVKEARKRLKNIDIDSLIDTESLQGFLEDGAYPMPTVMKTERPDKVSTALFEGKLVIIADNSPFALIIPSFLADFVNPQGDLYVKAVNANLLKLLRLFCLMVTIMLPGLYIAIINYNPETIPLNLLLSFQAARLGVPFPSSLEALFMIIVCSILRESDIRFPNNYGSSISILGALILGDAAVSANVVSPIMIIIIGVTFIAGLVFNSGNFIEGLRYYRLFLLICATLLGLYGFLIGCFVLLIHLAGMESLSEPYLFPVAPFNKKYLFKTLVKKPKDLFKNKDQETAKENK